MKKILSVLLLLLGLVILASCNKDDSPDGRVGYKISEIRAVNGGLSGSVNFTYNAQGLIQYINSSDYDSHSFEYDAEGRLIKQRNSDFISGSTVNFTYEMDAIKTVRVTITNDDDFSKREIFIDLRSSNAYQAYVRELEWTDDSVLSEKIFDISLQLDEQNRVVRYLKSEVGGSEEVTLDFEYTDENLTRIIENGDANNSWEMFYDNGSNYDLAIWSYQTRDSYHYLYLDRFLEEEMSFIPQMLFSNSKNNIVELKKGGETIRRYQYTYNAARLPTRITYPGNSDARNDLFYE